MALASAFKQEAVFVATFFALVSHFYIQGYLGFFKQLICFLFKQLICFLGHDGDDLEVVGANGIRVLIQSHHNYDVIIYQSSLQY